MSDASTSGPPVACGACIPGPCGGKGKQTLVDGIWKNNPIAMQVLGICSALAVTGKVETSLVMGAALVFVCAMSNLLVSLLRNCTPRRIRMIAEVAIIATFVILFDQLLKAFAWDMSKQLGPYVGLIITNCIVMGRAEAFAMQNPPLLSVIDGVANGLGYAFILAAIGVVREVIGTGGIAFSDQFLPHAVSLNLGAWYQPNQLLLLAPGAFMVLGLLIGLINWISPPPEEESK